MAGLPIFHGPHEQMQGDYPVAAPKSRELDCPLPVPENKVGDTSHLETPISMLAGGPLAACVEPAFLEYNARASAQRPSISGVHVEFV